MRNKRLKAWLVQSTKLLFDLMLWTLAAPLAFVLRVEAWQGAYQQGLLFYTLMGFPLKLGLIWFNGLHRQSWRRSSLWDLGRLMRAVVFYTFITTTLVWLWHDFALNTFFVLPRSIPFIEAAVSILFLGGARFSARWFHEYLKRRIKPQPSRRILLVGAGEAGSMLVREMSYHPEYGQPVAFLDDDEMKQGTTVLGVPVIGPLKDLPRVVKEERIDEVLIAMPTASGRVIRKVVRLCQQARVPSRIVPALHEILLGKVLLQQLRPVRIEDLLGREPVRLSLEEIASYLRDKRVLITGAGGSIGSEIVRQVIPFQPQTLILVGRGENSLYELEQELRYQWPDLNFQLIVADVRDEKHVQRIFQRWRPHIVFHAAAHKHVPLMEFQPDEAVRNNVFGTWNVVQAAFKSGVERFVNISTDKAVNPTSVMGATKRVGEYIVQAFAAQARAGQVFVSVRFGNVLGSRGSVIRLFQEQIRRGGPVTVTHPEMRRYFMTIPEAAQLVLQAGGLGDNGVVYVLDMGEPIRIVDLARDLIRLAGFEEDEIPIEFIGIRPGEKLFEELLTAEEGTVATRHERIFVAKVKPIDKIWLEEHLQHLREAAQEGDMDRIFDLLQKMIPTYRPSILNSLNNIAHAGRVN